MAIFLYVRGLEDTRGAPGMVRVVVANQEIVAGTRLNDLIEEGAFSTVSVPEDAVVEGAVESLTELRDQETSAAILTGEQVSTNRLRGVGALPGGTLGIPEGMQAVTLSLEAARAAGGVAQRGDRVTVYATLGEAAEAATTVALVPDAEILKVEKVDASIGGGQAADTTVTLALTPQDAQRVVFAHEKGLVRLALLPPGQEGVPLAPVTLGRVSR